jgi:hypothetical protein
MLETIFMIAAVVGGTVMVCQFLLTLMGMGDDGADIGDADGGDFGGDVDVDADFGGADDIDGDHHSSIADAADAEIQSTHTSWLFGVLSFRTLVAGAAFFGLSGMAARSMDIGPGTSLLIAGVVGLAAMYSVYWLMRMIYRLNSSGNERISNAIGRRATVYIPIPAERAGAGKVQLSMQNRIVEYQAVTEDKEPLKTGDAVEVVALVSNEIVKVRRVAQAVEA